MENANDLYETGTQRYLCNQTEIHRSRLKTYVRRQYFNRSEERPWLD